MTAPTPRADSREDGELLVTAFIPPHEMKPVVVGEYEAAELIPELTVEHQADGWDILEWVENHQTLDDGTIRVVLFVQNFGARVEEIRVLRAKE